MSPESFSMHSEQESNPDARISSLFARGFRELPNTHEQDVFIRLEHELTEAGFVLAESSDVVDVFNDNSLICRSESFSKVLDLLLSNEPIAVTDKGDANMCIIASGQGYRTAMEEGFSGRDVGGTVKTVITFEPNHLSVFEPIPNSSELWKTKPNTAQVSRIGGGEIQSSDICMVSFRFPVGHYPEPLLTPEETELLEENKIHFIVRHYCRQKEKAVH